MKSIDYGFTDYLSDLWNIFQAREGLSISKAAREVLDVREEAWESYQDDVPVQVFYQMLVEDKDE